MTNRRQTNSLSSAWIVLGCALAFSVTYQLTDRIRFDFQPGYFLPIFAAWISARVGTRVINYILLFGVIAALNISIYIEMIQLSLGFSTEIYLVSVLAAYAFTPSRTDNSVGNCLRPWWRWSLWIAICALALAGYLRLGWQLKFDGSFQSTWELGAVFTMLVTLATVNWSKLVAQLRPLFPQLLERPIQATAMIIAVCIIVVALFTTIRFPAMEYARVGFGLTSSWYWLTVICFAATAFGLLGWRALIVLLILLFAAEWVCTTYWFQPTSQPFVPIRGDEGELVINWLYKETPRWSLLFSAVSAALFGRAIEPLWSRKNINALYGHRTLLLLATILTIQFILQPLITHGQSVPSEHLLLGGVMFLTGLLWRRKALIGAPLIIMLCYLLGVVAYNDRELWWMSLEMGQFGLVAFPFVFFGLLTGERAVDPGTGRDVLRTVDVTPLATLVRELDVSATLKSFVAVLAPLVVLGNINKIMPIFTNILQFSFDFLESEDILFAVALFIITALGVLAPLAFIVTDWLARREAGRYISAVSGAALGLLGIMSIAQAFGASIFFLQEMEWAPFDLGRWVVTAVIAFVLALILGRMVAHSERTRTILLTILIVLGVTALGGVIFQTIEDIQEPEALQDIFIMLLSLVLVVMVTWFIIRGVRLRLLLSGTRPRSLLLGELCGGFWIRMAFLVGLPSSMWRLSSMKRPSFWLFISSRPLVYIGVALLVAKTSLFNPYVTLGLSAVLIISGHIAFAAAKRLASREVWRPEKDSDSRAPILFLRSFEDDQFHFKRPVWDIWGRWFDLWSFRSNVDEALIDEVAQYGPVVALGNPGETRAPFGALRHYAKSEDWQSVITDVARRAQTIILVAGSSQGVLWEYDLLKREGLIDRTLLLFRPGTDEAIANRRALEAFTKVQNPDVENFDDQQMVALLQTVSGPIKLVAQHHLAGAYIAALRAHFQDCSVQALSDPALLFVEEQS